MMDCQVKAKIQDRSEQTYPENVGVLDSGTHIA